MDAQLVLEARAEHVVAGAERAIVIDQEFRHQEQGDAPRAGRRVGKPRQHQMHDVVGEIMLAIGDEYLLAEDAVGSIAGWFGAGAQGGEIGAGLRLGQVHRPHPLAGDEPGEIFRLQRLGRMLAQRLDRAHGQRRADAKSHGG